MSSIDVLDRPHEFRITVEGKLSGEAVRQLAQTWSDALAKSLPRRVVVDISHLEGYDQHGRKLLRDMHLHGTDFAASTPSSLLFLAEVTAPRWRGVAVIPQSVSTPVTAPPGRPEREPLIFRKARSK